MSQSLVMLDLIQHPDGRASENAVFMPPSIWIPDQVWNDGISRIADQVRNDGF